MTHAPTIHTLDDVAQEIHELARSIDALHVRIDTAMANPLQRQVAFRLQMAASNCRGAARDLADAEPAG